MESFILSVIKKVAPMLAWQAIELLTEFLLDLLAEHGDSEVEEENVIPVKRRFRHNNEV